MNEEFYRRQAEANQQHERQHDAQSKHSTLETYGIEQGEANSGHIPAPQSDVEPAAPPSLWQRIKKMIGM